MQPDFLKPTHIISFLILIIQKADDKDVEQLLDLCSIPVDKPISATNQANFYKETLMHILLSSTHSLYDFYINTEAKFKNNMNSKNEFILLLLSHIFALNGCFYSYNIEFAENKFKDIFHILIENYKKYNFYYEYFGHIFRKIKIGNPYGCIPVNYKIIYKGRHTILIEEKTKSQFELKTRLKNYYKDENNILYTEKQTWGYFLKVNKLINEELSKQLKDNYCIWCNPVEKIGAKRKCKNCKNLSDILKEIKTVSNNTDFKKINFSYELKKISNINNKNFLKQRKKMLKDFVVMANINKETNKELLNRFNYALNKSFNV